MTTVRVQDEIRDWLVERLADVEQEGSLSAVLLYHFDSSHRETEIHAMKVGHGKWGDAVKMGDVFHSVAARHARGLIGAQQFRLDALYGSTDKPTRVLPFGLPGQLQFGAVPGGGMATEAPTGPGQTSQGMRMGEIVVQGMINQINPTFRVQAELISRLMQERNELAAENRELFIALRNELQKTVELAHERRMKELGFMRSTEERRRLIKLLPALINSMTGKGVFPESAQDTALIETLCENVSEQEINVFAAAIAQKNPEFSAIVLDRFRTIQGRRVAEANELARLAREATGGYALGEADAAGTSSGMKALNAAAGGREGLDEKAKGAIVDAADGKPAHVNGHSANGHANGANGARANGTAPPVTGEQGEDTKLLDDLLRSAGDKIDMLVGMIGMTDPELAMRVRARYDATKK